MLVEVLFFIEDKGPEIDTFHLGDVIDIHLAGWPWSQEERTRDNWRIISVDVLQSSVDALNHWVNADAVHGQKKRIRDYYIDPSLLPNPQLFIGPRTQEIISLTRKQVVDAVVRKP